MRKSEVDVIPPPPQPRLSPIRTETEICSTRLLEYGLKSDRLLLTGESTHPGRLRVNSRGPVELLPTRTLHRFWGDFRMGDDALETPDSLR